MNQPSHRGQVYYTHPILSAADIGALKSEAALLLHNELREASSQTLNNTAFGAARAAKVKRSATLALLESFIAAALGGNAKPADALTRHADADYEKTSRTIW